VCCCHVLQFCSRNFLGPISEAAVPGRLSQIRQLTQFFPLRTDSTWISSKYVKVWHCTMGKWSSWAQIWWWYIFSWRSNGNVGWDLWQKKEWITVEDYRQLKKPNISDILEEIKFNLIFYNNDEILVHTWNLS
jgi:hypothetical protein